MVNWKTNNWAVNWKLFAILVISFIVFIICYLTLDVKTYFKQPIEKNEKNDIFENEKSSKKIRTDIIIQEDDLKKIRIPDDFVLYYFPEKCPDYKQEYYLVTIEDNLEKFYVPEEKHMILIQKDHKWTKNPDFIYWILDNSLGV